MATIAQIVDELRRRGITVHEWPGWDGRGNSDGGTGPAVPYIDVVGAVIHHTATPYGSAYEGLASSTRPDLYGGCLCNFAGNDDGSLTVIASGLAWHAGPGVGPNLGPILGAIPGIRLKMNRVTAGLEIIYPGDQPMRDAQYRTATVFGSVIADLCAGGNTECVRAHAETNGNVPGGNGKWDPGHAPNQTIDMAAFRRDAATAAPTATPVPEDDMPTVIVQPGQNVTVPNPYGVDVDMDLFAACDNPGAVKNGSGTVVQSQPLRIALQQSVAPIQWRPAGAGGFLSGPDPWTPVLPLGLTAAPVGRFYALSVTNPGPLPVTVIFAEHKP